MTLPVAQATRQSEIEAAAAQVLETCGVEGATISAIAKGAQTSNETLYRWYGDKTGLFVRLAQVRMETLAADVKGATDRLNSPIRALRRSAPMILETLFSRGLCALRQAAVADHSGEIGRELDRAWQTKVLPLIEAQMQRALDQKLIDAPSAEVAATWFLALLQGDAEVHLATRARPIPRADEIQAQAGAGVAGFMRMCATDLGRIEPDPRLSML